MIAAIRRAPVVVGAGLPVVQVRRAPGELVRRVTPVWACWFASLVVLFAVAGWTGRIGPATDRYGSFLWPLWWWDFGWYFNIAHWGYPAGHVGREYAFFPLWVLVIKASAPLSRFVVPAAIAEAATLFAFAGAAAAAPGVDTRRTAFAIACYPGSFALALVYPDGLSVAAAAWACVLAARNRAIPAAACAAVAAAARPNGLLIAIPLAAVALRRGGRLWLCPAAALAAAAAVEAYFWMHSGSPNAFLQAQKTWGREGFTTGLGRWHHRVSHLAAQRPLLLIAALATAVVLLALVLLRLRPRYRPYALAAAYVTAALPLVLAGGSTHTRVETALAALACGLAVVLWWMGPRYRIWALYTTAVLAFSLVSGTVWSIGRHALFAFPLFWAIADGPRLLRSRVVLAIGFAANIAWALTLPQFPP